LTCESFVAYSIFRQFSRVSASCGASETHSWSVISADFRLKCEVSVAIRCLTEVASQSNNFVNFIKPDFRLHVRPRDRIVHCVILAALRSAFVASQPLLLISWYRKCRTSAETSGHHLKTPLKREIEV
jgi:hypothetical protein